MSPQEESRETLVGFGKAEADSRGEAETQRIIKESERVIRESSIGVLNLMVDMADSHITNLPESDDRVRAVEALQVLLGFADNDPRFLTARPRAPRIQDRLLLPGEHKGILLEFADASGNIARINVYRGLRESLAPEDMRDADRSLARLHAQRSEAILSHATEMNIHVKSPSEWTMVDYWGQYRLNQEFKMKKLISMGEPIDVASTLPSSDSRFKPLNQSFLTNVGALVRLIRSA